MEDSSKGKGRAAGLRQAVNSAYGSMATAACCCFTHPMSAATAQPKSAPVARVAACLEAVLCELVVLATPGLPTELYLEQLLERAVDAARHHLQVNVLAVHDVRFKRLYRAALMDEGERGRGRAGSGVGRWELGWQAGAGGGGGGACAEEMLVLRPRWIATDTVVWANVGYLPLQAMNRQLRSPRREGDRVRQPATSEWVL